MMDWIMYPWRVGLAVAFAVAVAIALINHRQP